MKTRKAYEKWLLAAGTFVICGCVHLFFDWLQYSSTLNSAPFSLWVAVNGIGFGIPAAICLLIGLILWKRAKKG